MMAVGVSAATDVTGFGFLGHLLEMARGAGVSVEIDAAQVPALPGALEHARAGDKPGGLTSNRRYVESNIQVDGEVDPAVLDLLLDPQTSGGLLISVPEAKADLLSAALLKEGIADAARVGRISGAGPASIRVR
jgi:selenide,water dikinase